TRAADTTRTAIWLNRICFFTERSFGTTWPLRNPTYSSDGQAKCSVGHDDARLKKSPFIVATTQAPQRRAWLGPLRTGSECRIEANSRQRRTGNQRTGT